jgi:hypothetical protein
VSVYLSNGVQVTVNSVDLSSLVSSVTLNRSFDELETTAMGDAGHRYVAGLEASSVTIDFFNDEATSKTLQTLNSSTVFGKNVTVTLKQSSGATAATNPLYTMTCLVNNTTPINGAVGDLSTQSVTWNVSGTVAITTS